MVEQDDIDPSEIANKIPVNVEFYPSEETMMKLMRRVVQIKDVEKDLWPGFVKCTCMV